MSGREDVYALGDCAEDRWLFISEIGDRTALLGERGVKDVHLEKIQPIPPLGTNPLGCLPRLQISRGSIWQTHSTG